MRFARSLGARCSLICLCYARPGLGGAMPAVRSSTGEPVILHCSEVIAQRLGAYPITGWGPGALDGPGLVFLTKCRRPYPLLNRSYWWPAVPGLGAEEGEEQWRS